MPPCSSVASLFVPNNHVPASGAPVPPTLPPSRAYVTSPWGWRAQARSAHAAATAGAVQLKGSVSVAHTTALDMVLRKGVQPHMYLMPAGSTIGEVLHTFVSRRVGHILLQDQQGKVTGMVTARDILRALDKQLHGMGMGDVFKRTVDKYATPASALVHVEFNDTLQTCALIMSEVKVRVLPVLKEGTLLGLITLKDIADGVNRNMTGGKDAYVRHVLPRRGATITAWDGRLEAEHLPRSLSEAVGPAAFPAPAPQRSLPRLTLATGATCIPGPGKETAEDAHFVQHLQWKHSAGSHVSFLGVADGVGSWNMRGVDPAAFASGLLEHAQGAVSAAAGVGAEPPAPIHVLVSGWAGVQAAKTVGSSTALVASVDHAYNQFATANLGDSGALVLRRVGPEAALGTMDMQGAGGEEGDWQVVFRTGQQLHAFNHPYQVGFDDQREGEGAFDRPEAADVARTPVGPGDIIVLASDGLFDNMHEEELVEVVRTWAAKHALPDVAASPAPAASAAVQALSQALADAALALSMDSSRDSPFAVLAKENDILWSHGGRMDDITVVCAQVQEIEE